MIFWEINSNLYYSVVQWIGGLAHWQSARFACGRRRDRYSDSPILLFFGSIFHIYSKIECCRQKSKKRIWRHCVCVQLSESYLESVPCKRKAHRMLQWGIPGIEPGTSRTRSEHNATIPNPHTSWKLKRHRGIDYIVQFVVKLSVIKKLIWTHVVQNRCTPLVGLEPTTTRLKVVRSADWAKGALHMFVTNRKRVYIKIISS